LINIDSSDWKEVLQWLNKKQESINGAILSPGMDDRTTQFYRGQAATISELIAWPDRQKREVGFK
jgi:hypothetical protein